jgi:hypothetical protein
MFWWSQSWTGERGSMSDFLGIVGRIELKRVRPHPGHVLGGVAAVVVSICTPSG